MELTSKDKDNMCKCPNCNSTNYLTIIRLNKFEVVIKCNNCGAMYLPSVFKSRAINKWNKFCNDISPSRYNKYID